MVFKAVAYARVTLAWTGFGVEPGMETIISYLPDKEGVAKKYMPLYGFQQDRWSVVQFIIWLFSHSTKAILLIFVCG